MTSLAFIFPVRCWLCGYLSQRMIHMFGARINKTSIRGGKSIYSLPRVCRECGWLMPDSISNPRMRPDEESHQKIIRVRRQRGWVS